MFFALFKFIPAIFSFLVPRGRDADSRLLAAKSFFVDLEGVARSVGVFVDVTAVIVVAVVAPFVVVASISKDIVGFAVVCFVVVVGFVCFVVVVAIVGFLVVVVVVVVVVGLVVLIVDFSVGMKS